MISEERECVAIWPGDIVFTTHDLGKKDVGAINRTRNEVLTAHDIGKGECVAIWPGDGVLTAHDIQDGEGVAIWPGDGVLTAHETQKGECVAIWTRRRSINCPRYRKKRL
ncbi:hypothetical protein BgiBS90_038331 [Biomphalaria glabrata]|nr:hypothetical protein BgiBS90_038331 [Biomphalaria glabrata]